MVITGASSGIGLCTAKMAAANGPRVVLTARNAEALADIERQLTADGGLPRFGGCDTWVNDAGVSIYGRLEEVSDEDHKRLFDTNFWGTVYGSQIAAKHLRPRGGAIVNVGSELSEVVVPIQG